MNPSTSWRARSSQETIARFGCRREGAGITRIADLTGLDRIGIPVHAAYRPAAHSYVVQVGKGRTPTDSYASAMMEAIEVFHAEQARPQITYASYDQLERRATRGGTPVASWRGLKRTGDSRFRPDLKIEWVAARNLKTDAPVLVPFELVHARHALPRDKGAGCFLRTTTGLASGNSLTEAMIHALCEIVERDAATLWLMSSQAARCQTEIDPRSIEQTSIQSLIDRVVSAGLRLTLHDITSDIGIATVHASISDPAYADAPHSFTSSGFGCHPHREVALIRAITEAAQTRLVKISGVRDELDASHYDRTSDNAPSKGRRRRPPQRKYEDLPNCRLRRHEALLAWVQKRLGERKIYVVDLTRQDFGVPVVRVIIPGLEDGMDVPNYSFGPRSLAWAISSMLKEAAP